MSKNVSDKKVQKTCGRAMWFSISALSFILLYIAISFINDADYFADNIKFLLDDPYIYWIVGWILFVISFIGFSVSIVNIVQRCVQYLKMKSHKEE